MHGNTRRLSLGHIGVRVRKIWASDCHTWNSPTRRQSMWAGKDQTRLQRWETIKTSSFRKLFKRKKKRVSTEWAMIAQFGGKITREGWVCSYMWWNIPEQGPKDLEGKGARCGSVGESPASRFSRWLKDSVLNLCGPIQNRVRGPPFSVHSWCVTVCFTHSHSNTDWSFIPLWKYLETAAHLWRA